MFNLIRYHFNKHILEMFKFSLIISIIFILYVSFYPYFNNDIAAYLKGVDKTLVKALHLDTLTSFKGYYAYLMSLFMIVLVYQALHSSLLIYFEEDLEKAYEYTYTLPITRSKYIVSKQISMIVSLLLSYTLFITLINISINLLKIKNTDSLLVIDFNVLIIILYTFALVNLISVRIKSIKSVKGISLMIVFVLYVVQVINNILNIKYLEYLNPLTILQLDQSYHSGIYVMIMISSIIMLVISNYLFKRKDLV